MKAELPLRSNIWAFSIAVISRVYWGSRKDARIARANLTWPPPGNIALKMSEQTGKSAPNASVIDHKKLASTYKKNGTFDQQRKNLLENFKESETHSNLVLKLKVMVESKIKNDPSILLKNKGKTAALIQGEVLSNSASGSSILSIVDKDIQEKIIDSPGFHLELRDELKDIRRKLLGISDENYAKQLQEEAALKEEERIRKEQAQRERETAYKNNYKVKQLSYPQRIAKPPRFSFGPKPPRDSGRDGDGSKRGPHFGGHLSY